jgi:hypothetical protein
MGASINGNVNGPLIQSGLANTLAAEKSTVPLLSSGVTANYEQGLNNLQNQAMQDQTALATSQEQFDASMASGTLSANASAASQAQQDNFANTQRVLQDVYNATTGGGLTAADQITAARDANAVATRTGYSSAAAETSATQAALAIGPKLPAPPVSGTTATQTAYVNAVAAAVGTLSPDMLVALYRNGKIPNWFPGIPSQALKG